ncbi:MAG TPA: hypothetical protein VLZ83_09405 [Edaphocola sp.]|nr:hypothetical protein [Edaphocola sp.]
MKYLKIIILLAISSSLVLGGCKKKDKSKLSKASFTINGIEWKSDGVFFCQSLEDNFSFTFARGVYGDYSKKDPSFGYDESLTLGYVVKKLGKQYLPSLRLIDVGGMAIEDIPAYVFFGTRTEEGCVSCEQFIVDSNALDQNWIEVIKEEGNYKKIWGKFNLVMIRETGSVRCNRYPDTIRIENGTFYLEL